jgi:tripartite-type tricarboxylate transporter receptor subunit TctC
MTGHETLTPDDREPAATRIPAAQARPSRALRGRRLAPAAAAVAAVALVAACSSSGSSASIGSGSSGGASALKGKTITLIAPDAPGGSYDSYARLFAPYIGQELGATVNVENVGGGGTLDGTNQMAAASPNGLTIGMVNVGGDVASKVESQPTLHDDVTKFAYIGQPAVLPNALVTQSGSSTGSFAALVHSSDPVAVLDIRNGIGDMLNRVVFGAFGIKHKLDTGFESTTALKQGFLAKDGLTIFEAVSTLYPLISGNQAKPLLVTGTVPPSYQKVLSGVPTLDSELSSVSLSASQTKALQEANALADLSDDFAAPPGTPAATVTALRQAFTKAAAQPALQNQAKKESLPLAFISGTATTGRVSAAEANSSTIAPYVK